MSEMSENKQQSYKKMRSMFCKENLHKIIYKDMIYYKNAHKIYEDMPACVYILNEKLIEMLVPLLPTFVCDLEWHGMKYEVIFQEQYSWRLHRLVCFNLER